MKFREDTGSASKDFVRLKDKESVVGVCAGDLYEFRNHWNGKFTDLCPEDASCKHCNEGKKANFRFRVNFIMKNPEGNLEAKILEQGWSVYSALRELHNEYDLQKHFIKITRHGSGLNDTEYAVIPVKNGALDVAKLETLSKVPLLDLKSPEAAKKEMGQAQPPQMNYDEEVPF